MVRLLVSRKLTDDVMAQLAAEFDMQLRETTAPMSADEVSAALADYDAILPTLGDQFTAEAINRVQQPRCRILANFGVGYNHIDTVAAAAKGITVTNTPGAVTDATADIAMALMLMGARRASQGERLLRRGDWQGWHPVQLLGMHLGGKTVGIIGMGRIGQAIAKRCHAGFGMNVLFYNRSPKADIGVPARQIEHMRQLLAVADVVVLAVPGSAQTHHLMDAQALGQMQSHAHLINISRGDVIDETALIRALSHGQIAGAGLDVYEHEPHIPDALRGLENVVLLPHLGTNSYEVRSNMGQMARANLQAFFAGREPENTV
ncbi:MAG: D-glycerate dehydrogenase [Rhodobacterales bacterium]|nr:MAG: D-glycerate dehydrogenase [Rhodobacterales bacterium]